MKFGFSQKITIAFVQKSMYLTFFDRLNETAQSEERAEHNYEDADRIVSFYRRRKNMSVS